jgi:hypothetical protein
MVRQVCARAGSDSDAVVARALIGVAADLQLELLDAEEAERVYEADLRRAVRRHLNRQLRDGRLARAEAGIGKHVFAGAGTTDMTITDGESYAAAIELKWWVDPANSIDDALWDAVKVATFVREKVCEAGYLIAAGAVATWDGTNPLVRFWKGGEWPLSEIQSLKPYYATRFGPGKGPEVLPAGLRSEPVGSAVPIVTVFGEWSVRACRVWPC